MLSLPVLTALRPVPAFARLTRYAGGENRLTEVLATTFEHVPELALAAARRWTSPSAEDAAPGEVATAATAVVHRRLGEELSFLRVATQVSTHRGVVDLTLRFGAEPTPRRDDVVLWVEIKHGAALHKNQIQDYVDDLAIVGVEEGHQAVVFLAPRNVLPSDDPPEVVPQRSWTQVGQLVAELARLSTDPVDGFLLKECLRYMSDEHLTEPPVILPEHLVALAHATPAENALVAVCEKVSTALTRARGRSPDDRLRSRGKPAFGWNYYDAWDVETVGEEAMLWLDWNASKWPSHQLACGRSLFFLSGLVANDAEPLDGVLAADPGRRQLLEAGVRIDGRVHRFERISDTNERFTQHGFPEQLLVGRTLSEQADNLAQWILGGFTALTAPLSELLPSSA